MHLSKKKQVDFGPRVPETEDIAAHEGLVLIEKTGKDTIFSVQTQDFEQDLTDGLTLGFEYIIASYKSSGL